MNNIKLTWKQYTETKDNFVTRWYWRKKYNQTKAELDTITEIMRSDVYKTVLQNIGEPFELKRYKAENKRLRQRINNLRDDYNLLLKDYENLKKEVNKDE